MQRSAESKKVKKSSRMRKSRIDRTTTQQIQCYLNYCNEYPELAVKQPKPTLHIQALWNKLVKDLNDMPGPTRTIKKWKEILSFWRRQARCRTRKLSAKGYPNISYHPYNELVQMEEKVKNIAKPPELSKVTIVKVKQSAKSEQTLKISNESKSDIEFPFDSIFVPDDDVEERSCTPKSVESITVPERKYCATFPTSVNTNQPSNLNNESNDTLMGICTKLVKCLETREEREELLFNQQQNVIAKLDQTLLLMTEVLVKLNDKLDKI